MNTFKNPLLTVVGLVIFVSALLLINAATGETQGGPPPAPTQNVNVVNTSANPVPTAAQGTTTVSGSVNIANTPAVSLATGASVAVNNPASNAVFVRSVDDRLRQIFQTQITVNLTPGSFGDHLAIQIPAGKRLVIEHVSVAGIDNGEEHLRYEITTQANTVQATHRLVSYQQGIPNFYYASQEMRVYGDPSSLVIFGVNRPYGIGTASATMTVSGYFVDVP